MKKMKMKNWIMIALVLGFFTCGFLTAFPVGTSTHATKINADNPSFHSTSHPSENVLNVPIRDGTLYNPF